MYMNKSLGSIEVDYEKKEVRAGGRIIDFGRISHYEFEHVETVWKEDYDPQDSDMRAGINRESEIMHVYEECKELQDVSDKKWQEIREKHWALCDKVELKLCFNYYQNEELKQSSLYFSRNDAIEARRKLKPLIMHLREWRTSDAFNMFVGEKHLRIGNLSSLSVLTKDFNIHEASLPVFGPCTVHAFGTDVITHISLTTKRRLREEEMLPMLEYMRKSMPVKPHYDDHGYGVMPKPHEIELVWELPQGNVAMRWDGFKYDRGKGPNLPKGDGYDFITIDLWDCSSIRRSRDEEYWRSEVD